MNRPDPRFVKMSGKCSKPPRKSNPNSNRTQGRRI
jgi:hypothetical protein